MDHEVSDARMSELVNFTPGSTLGQEDLAGEAPAAIAP
jgi:hypothetical protein